MRLIVLNNRGHFKRVLSAEEAKKLTWNEFCNDSQEILKGLKRKKDRIRCDCKVVMHVVYNPDTQMYFLRRNPSQTRQHMRQCSFWAPEGYKTSQSGKSWSIPKKSTDKYLLNARIKDPETCALPTPRKVAGGTSGANDAKLKYQALFGFLYTMLEKLGVNRYPNQVLGRNIKWDDVYRFLQGTPYKDLFWCPSTSCKGGAVGLNQKILKNWRDPERVGQGLLLGILDEIPAGKFEIRKYYKDERPIKSRVESGQLSVIGDSGPYFMLAVCTANTKTPAQFAVPVINRMALQSIKSWSSWIPVETDVQRKIITMLFKNKNPFEKLLFPKGLNLDVKPDFVIKDCCVVDLSAAHNLRHLESFFKLPAVSCDLQDTAEVIHQVGEKIGYSRPER